jgi:hypothetical protein
MDRIAQSLVDTLPAKRFDLTRRSYWSLSAVAVAVGGVLYWSIVELMGGFVVGDADSTVFSSVMFSHGYWACAYRSISTAQPLSGPIYPLASAVVQWITRAGFSPGYLSTNQIGLNCQHAYASYASFARGTNVPVYDAVLPTAMVAWFALTLAAIAIFRMSAWRATRITWIIPLAFALTPPVIFCVQEFYHPQDLWALAMAFVAVALGLRGRPFAAGIVWALAVMSQPFTLLGVVVVLVISSWSDRRRLVIGGVLCAVFTCSVLDVTSGSRAVSAALMGTGATTIHHGTWMAVLHVGSGVGLVVSRFGPLAGAALVAWWVRARRPDVVCDPVILLGLLATVWSLRLVFEENLWGYYCMATGATLVLRDIMARRLSRGTVYWLILVLFAFGAVDLHSLPWAVWPNWVWQLSVAPSAFFVALFSLRESMRTQPNGVEARVVDL